MTGLTPEQWEQRLERAAADPQQLAAALEQLDLEMRGERTWLHENPEPGGVLRLVLRFLGRDDDDDLQRLGRRIEQELQAERALCRRYRGWRQGERAMDVIYPYVKDFPGEVEPCQQGLQFAGFLKFRGVHHTPGGDGEAVAVYMNENFPGRDPANFRISYAADRGRLVIKRVFRKELPRRPGPPSTARAVLIELTDLLCRREQLKELVVDNAANSATREQLLMSRRTDDGTLYELRPGGRVEDTPLGKLMVRLARELGLQPGVFSLRVLRYGILEIRLPVQGAA